MKKRFCIIIFLFSIVFLSVDLSAQSTYSAKQSVRVSAIAENSPPRIILSWPSHPDASSYTVFRKAKADILWGSPVATLPSNATSWQDFSVSVGQAYEYQVLKSNSSYPYNGFGYIYAGIEYPIVEWRGTIIFIVDSTFSNYLADEIKRLELDMIGDGWKVIRHDVGRYDSIPDIKSIIINDVNNDTSVRALFLLGHVPVPYSGNINPDGHSNHVGAWPADIYYGELDGNWTDYLVNNTSASRTQNHNVPGDGKFDNSIIPSDVDLEVGRVDLSNMPAFSISEEDLLKQYLNKNHNYRNGSINAVRRGLVDDHFTSYTEAFASNGWRNFSAMFGASNVFALDYFSTMTNDSYLWSYGCGGGTYTSASGIGNTNSFANDSVQTVFTVLFGSYFGDWDSQNNFLRAPLASASPALLCFWAGRPNWYFHHMALGDHIGYNTRLSQNNSATYYAGNSARNIHVALMGDPTLRMHMIKPPGDLFVSNNCNSVSLNWTASPDTVMGYHIYQSDNLNDRYSRINSAIVTDTFYTDTSSFVGERYYMIRAMRIEYSGAGSYYNLSTGIIDSAMLYPSIIISSSVTDVKCNGNSDGAVDLIVNGGDPPYSFQWSDGTTGEDLINVTAGIYYVTLTDNSGCIKVDSVDVNEPDDLTLAFNVINDIGNACIGEAHSAVTGGTQPYSYLWNDPAQQNTSVATGLCAGWYLLIVTDSLGCSISDSIQIVNQGGVTISGSLYYDNVMMTPMMGDTVYLEDLNGNTMNIDTTDVMGAYSLEDVQAGNYLLTASSEKSWGGVNSTDALAIMQHFVGLSFLSGMKLKAADINASGYVNAADALYAQQRYVGMVNSFPSGDWAFNETQINVGTINVNQDIPALCFGDVNASYIPFSKKDNPTVRIYYYDTISINTLSDTEIAIPVMTEMPMTISAISMSIMTESDNLRFDGISLWCSEDDNLIYNNISDNEIRVSWYGITPIEINKGHILFYILASVNNVFGTGSAKVSITGEFADQHARVIQDVKLSVPVIHSESIKGDVIDDIIVIYPAFPNPMTDYTIVEYFVKKAGILNYEIFNSLGEKIYRGEEISHSSAGWNKLLIGSDKLVSGINFCKIIYRSENVEKIQNIPLIVNK